MEETKALLRQLHDDNQAVREDSLTLAGSNDRLRKVIKWGACAVVAVVIVAGLFIWRLTANQLCTTDRTKALTGPSTERINLFFQAYTEAAGQIDHKLTDPERERIIGGLVKDRETFSVLPARPKLAKATDFQLLAYRDLIAALRANEVYNAALGDHPVCSFWGI